MDACRQEGEKETRGEDEDPNPIRLECGTESQGSKTALRMANGKVQRGLSAKEDKEEKLGEREAEERQTDRRKK